MAVSTPAKPTRCTARSKQTSKPCKQPAIPGGTVCRYHGGAAPQVQRTAKQRLAAMIDPALDVVEGFIRPRRKGEPPRDPELALRAAKDILDRNNLKGVQKIAVSRVPFDARVLEDDELETAIRIGKKLIGKAGDADEGEDGEQT